MQYWGVQWPWICRLPDLQRVRKQSRTQVSLGSSIWHFPTHSQHHSSPIFTPTFTLNLLLRGWVRIQQRIVRLHGATNTVHRESETAVVDLKASALTGLQSISSIQSISSNSLLFSQDFKICPSQLGFLSRFALQLERLTCCLSGSPPRSTSKHVASRCFTQVFPSLPVSGCWTLTLSQVLDTVIHLYSVLDTVIQLYSSTLCVDHKKSRYTGRDERVRQHMRQSQ